MSRMDAFVFQNKRDQNLVGVMHYGKGKAPRPCLIVSHGFAGTKVGGSRRFVNFARYAVEHNLSVFRFDFTGSGDSDGELIDLTLDNEIDDINAAIDTVAAMDEVDSERICLVGHCLGAVTAIRATAKDSRIYSTVAWAPFTDLAGTVARLIGEDAFEILKQGEDTDFIYNGQLYSAGSKILSAELNMFDEIKYISQPLLIVHGSEDATVPLLQVEKLIDYAQSFSKKIELSILDGAHHSFPYHQEELFQLTCRWFL